MLTYLFAVLGAGANAASSVLQRKAHREHPVRGPLTAQAVAVLRTPVWLLGFAAVVLGFLLQAAALSQGALSVVEPIFVIELPFTLLPAGIVFHRRLAAREWFASLAMTAGVAAMLYLLSPTPKAHGSVSGAGWILGGSLNVAFVLGLFLAARWTERGRRAALLGVATGSGFGLTVALVKTMTEAVTRHGVTAAFATWQTYGMVLTGLASMLLLQEALSAGSLVAAQPGITLADPLVSVLWGVLAYGETIRTGGYLIAALGAALVVTAGALVLAHSPLLGSDHGDESGPSREAQPMAARRRSPRTIRLRHFLRR